MNWQKTINRFDLNNYQIVNQKVKAIATIQFDTLVN